MTAEAAIQDATSARSRPVGLRDIPLVIFAPRRLFSRVEDVPTYAWPLVVLLTAVTGLGYVLVQSGLIDRAVQMEVVERIAAVDEAQRNIADRAALREMYERERKQGEFSALLARMQAVVAAPLSVLAGTLLIAAFIYGAVALTGRKAEWNTLMNICVFAGYIDLTRLLVQQALVMRFATLEIDTSLAPLALLAGLHDPAQAAALAGALRAVDPFRLWFWYVVIAGLTQTTQLPGWRAWLVCGLCWLVGAGMLAGAGFAAAG